MSFANFFRKKRREKVLPKQQEKYNKHNNEVHSNSMDDIKNYSTGGESMNNVHMNGYHRGLIKPENRMDDVSVHLAVLKYALNLSRKSQLFKSLLETLLDRDALAYFMQFMHSKSKTNLVEFWLDVHSFKLSAQAIKSSNPYSDERHPISTIATTTSTIPPALQKSADNKVPNSISMPILSSFLPPSSTSSSSFYKSQSPPQVMSSDNNDKNMEIVNSEQPVILYKSNSFGQLPFDMENDALFIFTRYLTGDTRHKIDVPVQVQKSVAAKVCILDDQELGMDCFDECHKYVFDLIDKEYYPEYLQSSFHYKHQLDILTGNNLSIFDVIYHDTSLSYFTEFMEQEHAMDYLQCFLDVDNYHHHHHHLFLQEHHQQQSQQKHEQQCEPHQLETNFVHQTQPFEYKCENHQQQQQRSQQQHSNDVLPTSTTATSPFSPLSSASSSSTSSSSTSSSFQKPTLNHHSILSLPSPPMTSSSSSPSEPIYNSSLAQEDAMIIYDKFFSMQATRPLNFSDGVRLELEGSICGIGGVHFDCFMLPRSLLLYKMDQVHLPLFLKSDVYYKYLAELINSVHNSNNILGYSRRRQNSDTSSNKSGETTASNNSSITSRNTLLAVDTYKQTSNLRRDRKKSKEKLSLDGITLDPDHIWQRPNVSMKLGHVNDLGEFIPEFDPNPDSDKKSFFSTPKNKRSREEEEAMQIAQQIIQDVNIITSTAIVSGGADNDEGDKGKTGNYYLGDVGTNGDRSGGVGGVDDDADWDQ